MTKKARAVFDGKIFCPEKPVELETNDRYILKIEPLGNENKIESNEEIESYPAFDLTSLAVKTGITDLASEYDQYLYGTPNEGIND